LQALDFDGPRGFFLGAFFSCFSGGFRENALQNVVFCVVNGGEIVVKVWWK
jgi:hypothetical protein